MAPARKITKKRRGPRRVKRTQRTIHETVPPPDSPRERPRRYTYELGERICERLANGESATEICRDPSMPVWSTLKRWERDNPDFSRRYEIARKQCCEYHTDEIVTIADDSTNDYVTRLNKRGVPYTVFDRESFERSRLRVDSRKWVASKLLRHTYGEKSEVDVRTPDGVNVKVEERNALIESIVKLVHPKHDPDERPKGRREEARER